MTGDAGRRASARGRRRCFGWLLLGGLLLLAQATVAMAADAVPLTPQEQAWLRSAPPVLVGVQSDSAPYNFVDEQGHATGYSNDLFRLVAGKVGLRYRFAQGRPWETLWSQAQRGQVDVLTFLWRTPQRERFLRYVEPPYIHHAVVFAVRADDPLPPARSGTPPPAAIPTPRARSPG